jgi:probable phosphoglycerate mutase
VLWRHGQTRWNLEDRFQGHTDVELDETGQEQAQRAARLLAGLGPHSIVTSDLRRARDTAAVLSRLTGVAVKEDARLRETYGGTWQGLTVNEIRALDAEAYTLWRSGADVRAGGAESRSDVAARVTPAILEALDEVPEAETLVVVTHGGSARAAIGSLLELPMDRWAAVGGLSNCCWSVLEEFGPGFRLVEHNAGSLPTPVMADDE